ncbi:MAG: 2Fe-2S iron-sulfur cluster binding domain-containing protein [Spirochaetaceae bacterium]|jgi:carbon-monoxide dehydrogenase small subunit|nr:2Fe-2S iron-sulfur cluster binding domain-containing protein [Spirochaetaceae bacterium]
MTVGFRLNGEEVMIQAHANTRLVSVLRETFGLLETKAGCLIGRCGACSVIFNGRLIKSCLVPAFRAERSEIMTIEGFSLSDGYRDIIRGFEKAGVENCGYCQTGKVLAAESILARQRIPVPDEILAAFGSIRCRCTEPERLTEAVLAAADLRRRRIYGRSS